MYKRQEHLVYNELTVSLGAGRRHLLPTSMGGKRTDGENLEQVLIDRGYDVVTTKDEMDAVHVNRNTKLWGAFNMSHMDAEIDRPIYNPTEPSLAEMTAKAIEVLSQDRDGFFLMVEGSQVDWAGHNNDPIYMVTDFLAFDDAVKVAVKFAEEDGNTLVLAFPDHNTGGMKIGQYYQQMDYTATTVDDLIGPLEGMQVTSESVVAEMGGNYSEDNMVATIKQWWNIDATAADIAEINDLAPSVGMAYALARVISKNHTVIGWTTHGHNGEDVPVWIYPQSDAIGVIDNTDLPDVAEFWPGHPGPNTLDQLTKRLYVNVDDAFPGNWELDKTDPENYVLKIKVKNKTAELPISKDLLMIDGKEYQLGSLVVYAPLRDGDPSDGDMLTVVEDRVYIPQKVVKLINFRRW